MIGATLGLLGTAALAGTRLSSAVAIGAQLDGPATVLQPAERLRLNAEIAFPVELTTEITLLDNFGGFSTAYGQGGHQGIDIWRKDAEPGQAIVACVDAVIIEQNVLSGNQGNSWVIEDANGAAYRYHHLQEFAPDLEVGSKLLRGDVIGKMGSTGNPTAPHLHFEVRPEGPIGPAIDPVPLLGLPLAGVTVI